MLAIKKIVTIFLSLILFEVGYTQDHPNIKKIDSLKALILKTTGIQRIDCLNMLCEEYWWPPILYPDSMYKWANMAYNDAVRIKYDQGISTSIMLFGVSEIYKKKFATAEKHLRQALNMFEAPQNDFGTGWSNVWLGQSLYFQNKFDEALASYKTSLIYLNKLNDWDGEAKAWAWMGSIYANLGNYDSSYFYSSQSLFIRQKMSDHACVANAYIGMGNLFKVAGAYTDALDYTRRGYQYAHVHNVDDFTANWVYFEPVGSLFRMMGIPDSSYYYLQKALQIDPANQTTRISFAETLLMKTQYDSALNMFIKPLEHFRKENNQWDLMRVLLDVAKAYSKKMNNKAALPYALESLSIAQHAGAKQFILNGYLLLSKVYQQLHVNDSAYFFLDKYTVLNDSVVNNQFRWKLSNFKKQTEFESQQEQLSLLDKQNKIKEDKLKQESLIKWILIICLLMASLAGFIIFRNLSLKRKNDKLENQKKQSELQLKTTELEMQALRAQMNPHFIFNCLSSINSYILKNETESASDYLTKFSRLIRMVLSNSNKPFISLEDDLNMLTLYLDMERLRFKNSFDYNIVFNNSIDSGNILIPPLLLQPFAENAIWHGLMHKPGLGKLDIILSDENKILTCCICDNGIGISQSSKQKNKPFQKEKSLGLKITADRLAILNKEAGPGTSFTIEDIKDDEGNINGTKVTLKIHYKSLMEVRA